jgi:hypothetical protein
MTIVDKIREVAFKDYNGVEGEGSDVEAEGLANIFGAMGVPPEERDRFGEFVRDVMSDRIGPDVVRSLMTDIVKGKSAIDAAVLVAGASFCRGLQVGLIAMREFDAEQRRAAAEIETIVEGDR